jgi:hypothetical protein
MKFSQFLKESKEGKNVHLEHLEDEVLNRGLAGANDAVNFLRSLRDMLSGDVDQQINITTKWDGAPAIVCGIDPESKKFFVGTKSVFAKSPKLNFTDADIDKNHPAEGLNKKLKVALRYLSEIGIKGVLQGDMLFTKGDLKSETIDGEHYYTFQPNTIVYAVPKDSTLIKRMLEAEIGIVFHTSYHGKTMADMQASFNVDIGSLHHIKSVWFRDASFVDESGLATFTKEETQDVTDHIVEAQRLVKQLPSRFMGQLLVQEKIIAALKKFQNAQIRQGQSIEKPPLFINQFIRTYETELNQEILSAKKAETKANRTKEKTQTIGFLRTNYASLIVMIELMNALVQAKLVIVRKIQQIKSLGTFLRTDTGFRATTPEGFVAVNLKKGNAVKLIDRLIFSRANFQSAKNWEK